MGRVRARVSSDLSAAYSAGRSASRMAWVGSRIARRLCSRREGKLATWLGGRC